MAKYSAEKTKRRTQQPTNRLTAGRLLVRLIEQLEDSSLRISSNLFELFQLQFLFGSLSIGLFRQSNRIVLVASNLAIHRTPKVFPLHRKSSCRVPDIFRTPQNFWQTLAIVDSMGEWLTWDATRSNFHPSNLHWISTLRGGRRPPCIKGFASMPNNHIIEFTFKLMLLACSDVRTYSSSSNSADVFKRSDGSIHWIVFEGFAVFNCYT